MDIGFLVAEYSSFYGTPLPDIMKTSARVFWFMLRQIYRVRASEDLRKYRLNITLAGMSPNSETISQTYQALVDEVGFVQEVSKADQRLDEKEDVEGKAFLRRLSG